MQNNTQENNIGLFLCLNGAIKPDLLKFYNKFKMSTKPLISGGNAMI